MNTFKNNSLAVSFYSFLFSSRIIGLCLLQNELCPIFLNRHVIKYMLNRSIRWHDLAFFDPGMYESLRQLVLDAETKNSPTLFTALDLTFNIELSNEEVRSEASLKKLFKAIFEVSE